MRALGLAACPFRACLPYCCRREIRNRDQFLPSDMTYLAICDVACREKKLQELSLVEAESVLYCPTLPSVYISQSVVLRWGLLG